MRQQALEWWNSFGYAAKNNLCIAYYPDRNYNSLTGREIELIYAQEKLNDEDAFDCYDYVNLKISSPGPPYWTDPY